MWIDLKAANGIMASTIAMPRGVWVGATSMATVVLSWLPKVMSVALWITKHMALAACIITGISSLYAVGWIEGHKDVPVLMHELKMERDASAKKKSDLDVAIRDLKLAKAEIELLKSGAITTNSAVSDHVAQPSKPVVKAKSKPQVKTFSIFGN